MKIRSFIALELTDSLRQSITAIQEKLKILDVNVSWVKPKNIHITLKFLGDVKTKKIDSVKETIQHVLGQTASFPIELSQLGAFPNFKRPKVIWIGVSPNADKIKTMADSLENGLGQIGFKKEDREFGAHITIGRVRSPKNLSTLTEALETTPIPPGCGQTIESVTLFKSTLTSQGPIYEVLQTVPLK